MLLFVIFMDYLSVFNTITHFIFDHISICRMCFIWLSLLCFLLTFIWLIFNYANLQPIQISHWYWAKFLLFLNWFLLSTRNVCIFSALDRQKECFEAFSSFAPTGGKQNEISKWKKRCQRLFCSNKN